MEWDPEDVSGFHAVLKGYNIAAILYGHTHVRNVFRWNGSNKPTTDQGIPTLTLTTAVTSLDPNRLCSILRLKDHRLQPVSIKPTTHGNQAFGLPKNGHTISDNEVPTRRTPKTIV